MALGVHEFHEERKFNFEPVIPGAEHIKGMAEEPCLIVAVPSPACIRVGIMPSAVVPVGTVLGAGRTMPADPWLIGYLLSFGTQVEIIEPKYLKNVLAAQAQEIYRKNKS